MKHRSTDRAAPPFAWPADALHIALIEPEIPPNTGTIARLCAATGSVLHLVGPLGFRLDNRSLRRAGLDYWDAVRQERHITLEAFEAAACGRRQWAFSAAGDRLYTDVRYAPGDILVFGAESAGLPESYRRRHAGALLAIPVRADGVRSLNLATAVAIALYEALRQVAAPDAAPTERPVTCRRAPGAMRPDGPPAGPRAPSPSPT